MRSTSGLSLTTVSAVVAIALGGFVAGSNASVAIQTDTAIWSGTRTVSIIAAPNSTFTLRYKRGATVLGTQPVTMGAINRKSVTPNVALAKGDTVEVIGKSTAFDTFVSNVLDTPSNFAVANHTLDQGTLVGAGLQFDLSGGFAVVADAFNPGTGDISGYVPAADVAISGIDTLSGDTVQMLLAGDASWSANIATALAAADTIGTSTSFNFNLNGTLLLNGVSPLAFTGTATGTSTYDLADVSGAHETYNVDLLLDVAGFGIFQGNFTSQGIATVVVPAPGATVAIGLGGPLLLSGRRRRAAGI